MRMYIISYFGTQHRDRRRQIHQDQLQWAADNNLEAAVIQQDYQDHEYEPNVVYIGDNVIRPPGASRNIGLREFYASEDDWAVFADNDSIAQNTVPGQDWLQTFRSLPYSRLSSVDCFQPVNGQRTPFTQRIQDNLLLHQENLCFERTPTLKGSFFVLRNLRKHNGTEIYQDENSFVDPTGLLVNIEDTKFGLELWRSGFSSYTLWNCKLQEKHAKGLSTWLTGSRAEVAKAGKKHVAEFFGLEWNEQAERAKSYDPVYQGSTRPKKQIISITDNELFVW